MSKPVIQEYIPVPVEVAREIALKCNKSQIVILAFDPIHKVTHTTTYGVSAWEKENAASVGVIVTNAIGADLSKTHTYEDFHDDYRPALFKEALDLMRTIVGRNDGCRWSEIEQMEKLLKQIPEK